MQSSVKQMTIPGVTSNSPASAAAAAAAADASAMPPPTARTAGAAAAVASTTVAHASTGVKQVISSVPRTPNPIIITSRVPTASAVTASAGVVTARTTLGTPSPLGGSPTAISATAQRSAAVRPATITTHQQALLAAKNAQVAKTATPIVVPSPISRSPQYQPRPAAAPVPQPVLSSAHAVASTTANATTYHVASAVGRHQQQQRVATTSYLTTTTPAPQIPSIQTMKRVAVTAVPKPAVNRHILAKPNMAQNTIVRQSVAPIPAPIPAPTPVAPSALHHPATVTSAVTHVSHLPMAVAPPMAPPPPPPEILPTSNGNSGGNSSKKKSGHPLRRGKWTSEEEAYAARLINEFKSGLLPLTDGTTLRNFLSKLLNCDPMRISKKFVGNNCIGKQVFRRRVADINRLSPDQIQQIRADLSELERRFFDRVAQTNRVKSPGVSAAIPTVAALATIPANATINVINVGGKVREELEIERPPTPPWLRPPASYKPKGKFAEKLVAKAPPALVAVPPHAPAQKVLVSATPPLVDVKSDVEKAMETMQRSVTSLDRLAHAASNEEIPRTESALEQLARTASAAKFVEDIVNGEGSLSDEGSPNRSLSRSTLQGSFEALMSMDIHSVENLVELAASSNSTAILSELNKNYNESVKNNGQSSANLSTRMESFIKSLSSANLLKSGMDSQQALGSLLNAKASTNNMSAFDAERFGKRVESSTGFSQLRAEDGLASGAHNSVDDFLSLVASGDIPHQDPNMLKVPLQKVMQHGNVATTPGTIGSKRKLSQQHLAALASRLSDSGLKKRQKK